MGLSGKKLSQRDGTCRIRKYAAQSPVRQQKFLPIPSYACRWDTSAAQYWKLNYASHPTQKHDIRPAREGIAGGLGTSHVSFPGPLSRSTLAAKIEQSIRPVAVPRQPRFRFTLRRKLSLGNCIFSAARSTAAQYRKKPLASEPNDG